jgi:hypothetical protein
MLDLESAFPRKKSQKQVAEFLLRKGIRVSEDRKFFFGDIEVSSAAIARSLDLDRRVVTEAAGTIVKTPKLSKVFAKLGTILLLRDVASEMGFGAIEIMVEDAASRGIIAGVTRIIADAGISIRQITADDPMFKNAEMTVVTEKPVPGELIEKIMKLPEVKKVIVLS